jgi:hypothetical protein
VDWLKRYRIWRASRKEFLAPENWIEPELKDDKTPAFPPESRTELRRTPRTKSDTDK